MNNIIMFFNYYVMYVFFALYALLVIIDLSLSFANNRRALNKRRSLGSQKRAIDRIRHNANIKYLSGIINERIHDDIIDYANYLEERLQEFDAKYKHMYDQSYVKGFKYIHKLVDGVKNLCKR